MFIEALHKLNWRLKEMVRNAPTVVAFIITKAAVKNINVQRPAKPVDVRRPSPHLRSKSTDRMGHPALLIPPPKAGCQASPSLLQRR